MNSAIAKIYGTAQSPEAYEVRDFLARSNLPYEWTELRTDEEARAIGVSDLSDARLPMCVLGEATVLYRPTIVDLAGALDWFGTPKLPEYDLVICGAGPAGLSAAVYAASEGLKTVLLERSAIGGQAGSTSRIENYLGFPDGISGWELATRARRQAQRLGAEIIVGLEGLGCEYRGTLIVGYLTGGVRVASRAVICATGVEYTRLGLPEEERFLNKGLYYGAGPSEAALCSDHVFIVGGGNSAGQAALHFAEHAAKVTLLVRGEQLCATLSTYLLERIEQSPRIEVCTESVLKTLEGTDSLTAITYEIGPGKGEYRAETRSVFVCIGGRPRTDWAEPGTLRTDRAGYILTGNELADVDLPPILWDGSRRPMQREASLPGFFIAGDVRHNSIKRFATAVGEGAIAVSMVHQYLAMLRNGERAYRY